MNTETLKKVFLVVTSNSKQSQTITDFLNKHYHQPTVTTAINGKAAILQIKKSHTDVVIADTENDAEDSFLMVENLIKENFAPHISYILVGPPPKEEKFLDEMVSGKLYFLEKLDEDKFDHTLVKALNYNSHAEHGSFYMRYLAKGDLLIKQGEKAEFVYILKSGELQAFNMVNGEKVILGNIEVGEFVGEMAYINNEPRSASIEALTDAELIEVPLHLVDTILYTRPAWAKALHHTLSKRLKHANKLASKS